MKEFLAGFQVDTENKVLAGVCAGLGNYFNIQTNIVRLVTLFLFLSSTEIGIITVALYAYLAGWLGKEPLGDGAKKARNQAILLFVVCLLLVSLGAEGLTAIFESGKAFGQYWFRKRLKYGKESHNFCTETFYYRGFIRNTCRSSWS